MTTLFVFLILGLIIWGALTSKPAQLRKKEHYESIGLNFITDYDNIDYYGGFKDWGCKKDIKLIVFDGYFRLDSDYSGSKIIEFKDIKDCRIQTEKQLSERVSMGKLLCFGVLAFGMKGKQKELSKDYVLVRCNYENEDIDLVLDLHSNNERFVRYINTLADVDEELCEE